MTKLTDTQIVLLSAAAKRDDGAIQIPQKLKGGAAQKVVSGLIAKKLVKAVPRKGDAPLWRKDTEGRPLALKVTPAGLKAIGSDETGSARDAETDLADEAKRISTPSRLATKGKRPRRAVAVSRGSSKPTAGKKRADTKQTRLIAMLSRKNGATAEEIGTTFGWQRHTVRGAIAGALKKKLGLTVISEKGSNGARVYRIAS